MYVVERCIKRVGREMLPVPSRPALPPRAMRGNGEGQDTFYDCFDVVLPSTGVSFWTYGSA